MSDPAVVIAIAGALAIGAMSPGPGFVFTAQTSLARSRGAGLRVALGLGLGSLVYSGLALAGLIAALAAVEPAFVALKVLGALYLLRVAVGMWRGARTPLAAPGNAARRAAPTSGWRASLVLRGLAVQVSNPKTAVVYASVFAALLPADPDAVLVLAIPVTVFVVEAGWYSAVAVGMSTRSLREGYRRAKVWVDRCASAVLAALSLRILVSLGPRA